MKKLVSFVCAMALLLSVLVLPAKAEGSGLGDFPKTGILQSMVVQSYRTLVTHHITKDENRKKVLDLLKNFRYTSSEDVSKDPSFSSRYYLSYVIAIEVMDPSTDIWNVELYEFESDSILIDGILYRGKPGYFDSLIELVSSKYIEYPIGEGKLSFFKDEENYLTLCKSSNLKGDIVIPDTVNGKPVTVIYHADGPMSGTSGTTYTPLSQGYVTSWTLPSTLKKLEVWELNGYCFFNGDFLKEIVFPGDGPEVLPPACFGEAENVERIVLPKKVKEMDGVFARAINGGTFLRSFCRNVKEIVLDPANPYFVKDEQGVIYTKDKTKLVTAAECAAGRTELTIPDTVTEVAPGAIAPNVDLQKVYGGAQVKKLPAYELSACKNLNPFSDTYGHWSEEYAKWAFQNDIFAGTGAFSFSPDNKMTRGMVAAVLHRLEGEPSQSGKSPFADVPTTAYYAKAALWASKNSIVYGYDSKTFAPNDSITREQMACMLYRYAKLKGEVSPGAALDGFTDADKVHDWALEAMRWAVGEGIISGKGNDTLDPRGTATRAEVAVVLKKLSDLTL